MKFPVIPILAALLSLTACEKILEIDDPIDSLDKEVVYANESSIKAVRDGIYAKHLTNIKFYRYNLELYLSICSDNLVSAHSTEKPFYQNTYDSGNDWITTSWTELYSAIYIANDFIENIAAANLSKSSTRDQYIGEAKWFRALDHFMLANLWGDVPIITSASADSLRVNSLKTRTPRHKVYEFVISELIEARNLMAGSKESNDMATPDAATALLARTYLYDEQWQAAADAASLLIPTDDGGSGTKYRLETIERVFKEQSDETIFQIEESELFYHVKGYIELARKLLAYGATEKYYFLTQSFLIHLLSDSTDQRKQWIKHYDPQTLYDTYYPYKYHNTKAPNDVDDYECDVMFRLAEQYLIRAEACAHLGQLDRAIADINAIRRRAGLSDFSATTAEEVLAEIELQREKEFFVEGGHRWFDLNRTGRADAVYAACGYKEWESYKSLMPIPTKELLTSPNLTQNPGW